MRKSGLIVVATIAIVGGIFVATSDMTDPGGHAIGTAAGSAGSLVKGLKSSNRKTRRASAAGLARLGDLSTLGALSAALSDEDMEVASQVRQAIDAIVERFPKNLGDYEDTHYKLSIAAIRNDTGEGGDSAAALVKEGILGVMLTQDNVAVGESVSLEDEGLGIEATAQVDRVALDLSGRITRLDDKGCRMELELGLTEVGVVVERFRKVRARGDGLEATAKACGDAAAKQILKYLGATGL